MSTSSTRTTPAKKAVITLLKCSKTPLTLQEIFNALKQLLPKTAYSTVYRILQTLEKEALIVSIDWRERGSRYEWAGLPHHHHIVCEECNCITDIDDKILNYSDSQVTKETGFIVKHHSIELVGVCTPCQNQKEPRE